MVFKAYDKNTNTYVALKKVKVPLTEDGVPMNTLREIALLKQLDSHEHPNIVRLLDVCHGQKLVNELIMFLVFEHLEEDLASYLNKIPNKHTLGSVRIRQMAEEILKGVDFLHSHRIIHRDLKPQNILVSKNGHLKLADFGLAKSYDFDMKLTRVVVTLWYRAPEVLLEVSYASPVDVWSVGCIIAELYSLTPLFVGESEIDQLNKIFKYEFNYILCNIIILCFNLFLFRILGKPEESEWPAENPVQYNSFEVKNHVTINKQITNLCENAHDLIMVSKKQKNLCLM